MNEDGIMAKLNNNQISSASVRFLSPAAMVHARTQHNAIYMARLFVVLSTVFVKQCFGGGASTGPVGRL